MVNICDRNCGIVRGGDRHIACTKGTGIHIPTIIVKRDKAIPISPLIIDVGGVAACRCWDNIVKCGEFYII